MPLSRRLTHFSLPLDVSRASARDHFSPISIAKHTTFGHPRFRNALRKIVSLTQMAHGKQRAEKKSAQWFQFICLVCAARWKRSVRLRNVHFMRESPKLERWAKLGCLAFILQRILELPVMRGWSFAGTRNWPKSCAVSENTEWNRAISIMSLEAIFASTKYRRQYSRLSFHIWKNGQPHGAPLRIFMARNWRARD